MKISVITVVFNAKEKIEQTMLSVLEQTYSNIEYVIIDGESTDGTLELIEHYVERSKRKEFKGKVIKYISEIDRGIYDAMNKGISLATGEWINFMNAGDIYYEHSVLSKMIEEITDDIKIIRGNIVRIYPNLKIKSVGVTTQEPSLLDMFNNTFHHQATLIQTSLFYEISFYSLEYKLCSDWKFFFDCTVLHKIKSKYVDIIVASFKMDGVSSTKSLKYLDEQQDYLKKLYGYEMFEWLQELTIYRKSKFIQKYYKLRTELTSKLSQGNFNRLLTLKRILRDLLGMKVN